ncbi:MAG: DUF2085 domain-containing protein [Planctomycetes bacterium]|nr:DUF2085 domain-containing protein [Planctomycetota bacterium]
MLEVIERICSSVCHTLPDRTFWFGGAALPLCARCTGVYVGFLLTMAGFACTRLRRCTVVSGKLLALNILLIVLFGACGFAGLYGALALSEYPRLLLGLSFGFAIATFAFPLTRGWLLGMECRSWDGKDRLRFLCLLAGLLPVSLAIQSGWAFLFWPVSLLAVVGLIGSHFLADILILSWLFKPRRRSIAWGAAVPALAAIMCTGEFFFYAAWRHWWNVL